MRRGLGINDQIAVPDRHSTVMHLALIRIRQENDRCTLWRIDRVPSLREVLTAALHPKIDKIDLREVCAKLAVAGNDSFDIGGTNRLPMRKRVRES